MTADELLHNYFDVLAVEQLQPETCVLLNEFRVKALSQDKVEKGIATFALTLVDSNEFQKVTLLWTKLFFEAQINEVYSLMNGKFIIEDLLIDLYCHSKATNEQMLLALLDIFEPIFYKGNVVVYFFIKLLKKLKERDGFSSALIVKLKTFHEQYQVVTKFVVVSDYYEKEHQQLQESLKELLNIKPLKIHIYMLFEKYGVDPAKINLFPTAQNLKEMSDDEFQYLVVAMSKVFFDARDAELYSEINKVEGFLIKLYQNKKAMNEAVLLVLLDVFRPIFYYKNSLVRYFIGLLEKYKKKNSFSSIMLVKIQSFYERYKALKVKSYDEKEHLQLQARIKALITPTGEIPNALPFDNKIGQHFSFYELRPSELNSASWPALIAADIATMPLAQQHAWNILWAHAAKADGGSPKKTWLTHAKTLVTTVEDFNGKATQWLELVLDDVKDNHIELSNAFSEANKVAIKGFIWLCSLTGSEVFASVLGGLVGFGYSKAYGVGARAPAVANAALYTLGLLGAQGVVQLSKLRSKVKFKAGLKLIEKSLAEAAARQGISQDDLEELSVPLFGLNAYSKQATFGSYRVVAHLQGSKSIEEHWSNSRDGSPLKKMPASVKQSYRSEFKEWQKEITDIQDVLTGQIKRLEDSYLRKRQWHFSDWQARFIQHPLLSWLGKRLIWRFEHQGQIQHGLFLSDSLVNAQQQPLTTIADDAVVTLWHPILSTVEEVQQWRTLLTAQQIVQPIKQAYREVYFITPAEIETGDYSNRFARHILKQHHFAALCKERGWGYRLQGNFDGHNHPCQGVPAWQIGVRLELDIPEGSLTTAAGLYQYITTAAVRFSHAGQSCALVDVPPIVFSEMMRDIDLFVGVTSIGTDAATDMYADNNHADYIDAFSKAELSARAIVRKEVLSNIISKLAIAPRCSFDNKHLIVKGDLRTYKIHLGSSNILMEPNDQYLCIVPSSKQKEASTEGLYLPFEGDHMLSVILSKALLLAADKKIKDEGIVSQIKRV